MLGELKGGCSDPYAPIDKDLADYGKKLDETINPPNNPGGGSDK